MCYQILQEALVVLCQLTHKEPEMHRCIPNIVATDGLVLKFQAISIHSAE